MLSEKNVYIATDRLGSVRADSNGVSMSYFPWGEERGTGTADGRTKFAGYYRDAPGQDYANARYYSASSGSFWSPDPGGMKTATPGDPTEWNRYAYAGGDPINFIDPGGRERCDPDDDTACFETDVYLISIDVDGGGDEGGGDYGGDSGTDTGTQKPKKPKKPAKPIKPAQPIQLPAEVCDPAVIATMAKAWAATGNGTSGTEAGFSLQGSSSNFTITYAPSNNTTMSNTIPTPAGTFDIFHVHPTRGDPTPSSGDINVANQNGFDMFTFSQSGLYEYDPSSKTTIKLRNGLDWLKPCPTN
jgi:RHS repeat-associated protein